MECWAFLGVARPTRHFGWSNMRQMHVESHVPIQLPDRRIQNLDRLDPPQHGSVRPTQGRTLGLAMVSGVSQSFNTANSLPILGRWMRKLAIPNQSSVPRAYTLFTSEDAE